MRCYRDLVIANAIAVTLAVVPIAASATASGVLTVGTNGPAAAVGDVLWGVLSGNAKFGNLTCTSSRIDATVAANPTPPGTAALSITNWTFGGCTANGTSVTLMTNASSTCPFSMTVDDSTSPATVAVSASGGSGCAGILFTVGETVFGLNVHCIYSPTSADIFGSASLGAGFVITFNNQGFSKSSGPGICPGSASFTATYTFTDHTQGGGTVFVN